MQRELFDSAVERDVDRLLHTFDTHAPQYFSISSIQVPDTKLAQEVVQYVQSELTVPIFNHCQRTFLIGSLVHKDQFPSWKVNMEHYFLTCMLHDIGVAPKYHLTTSMSFELKGGIIANNFITSSKNSGYQEVADIVSEACVTHTVINKGKVPPMGKLMQLSAFLDVTGSNPELYHPQSIAEIIEKWPLENFHSCFADIIDLELKHKPGCHISEQPEGFSDFVRSVDFLKIFNINK